MVGPVKKVVSSCEKKNGGVGRTASNAGSSDRSGVKSLKSSRSCREGMPGRDGVPNAEKVWFFSFYTIFFCLKEKKRIKIIQPALLLLLILVCEPVFFLLSTHVRQHKTEK